MWEDQGYPDNVVSNCLTTTREITYSCFIKLDSRSIESELFHIWINQNINLEDPLEEPDVQSECEKEDQDDEEEDEDVVSVLEVLTVVIQWGVHGPVIDGSHLSAGARLPADVTPGLPPCMASVSIT